MPRPESIFLAIDLTPASAGVVHRALWAVRHGGARRVHLLHVLDTRWLDGLSGLGLISRQALEERACDAADGALDALAARFRAAGAGEVRSECRRGRPDVELAAAVQHAAPDLVLAGAGNRMWRQVVLGSTVRRLLRSLNRPLWLVRGDGDTEVRRILLASDLGPAAAAAARLAAQYWPEAEFELLHAIDNVPDFIAGLAGEGLDPASLQAAIEQRGYQRLAAFATDHLPGIKVVTRLEQGHPAGVVVRRLKEAAPDLLVLGRSGRSGLEAMVLGSVAEALVDLAECDLLLVPGPG